MKFDPRPYQSRAVEFLADKPYAALWADMGLGKTVTTLSLLAELLDRLEVHHTLVVAPKRVALSVWAQEVSKWDHTQGLSVSLIIGSQAQRQQALRTRADIHVINFENLRWLVNELAGKWPWDHVVVDESSKIKDTSTWRFKALWHVRPAIRRMLQLTGTPASNGLQNIWGQIYMLDKGKRLGRTEKMFQERWFYPADREGRRLVPKDGALEEITELLSDIVFSLSASDYLDLPPLVRNTIEVKLAPKLMADYRRLERELFLKLSEEQKINAANAAVVAGKCLQFANGAVWLDDEDERVWKKVHDEKLEALDEILESSGEPALVAYQYQHDLERLKRHLPQAVVLDQDPNTIDRWNRGEIPVLLVHPRSAGHGLNLQYGGRTVVFFSLTWSLEDYDQLIERVGPVRQLQAGHPRTVYVHHIVASGTIDDTVMERLQSKASLQDLLRKRMRQLQPRN